jgi:hypothetical protein
MHSFNASASAAEPASQPPAVTTHECQPATEPIYLSWFREAQAPTETVPEP